MVRGLGCRVLLQLVWGTADLFLSRELAPRLSRRLLLTRDPPKTGPILPRYIRVHRSRPVPIAWLGDVISIQ